MSRWSRTTKNRRCPICKSDHWCLISPDSSAVICMRTSSDREKRLRDGSIGWIHRVGDALPIGRQYIPSTAAEVNLDIAKILARYSMDTLPSMIAEFAIEIGVTSESLCRLYATWSKRYRAWAFPMDDGTGRKVGIRLRGAEGKWCVRGSHPGLFVPTNVTGTGPIIIAEGPTDTAAMLDLGFDVVGRPSCTGGMEELRKWLAGRRQERVIISDTDVPGRLGAAQLALDLGRCKIVTPARGKDAREWKKLGATRAVVSAIIANTKFINSGILREMIKDLTQQLATYRRARSST